MTNPFDTIYFTNIVYLSDQANNLHDYTAMIEKLLMPHLQKDCLSAPASASVKVMEDKQ